MEKFKEMRNVEKLEQLKKQFTEARQTELNRLEKIVKFSNEAISKKAEIDNLKNACIQAEAAKNKAYESFVMGDLEKSELESLQSDYKTKLGLCAETVEMYETINSTIERIKAENKDTHQAIYDSRLSLGRHIADHLKNNISDFAKEELFKAYIASLFCQPGSIGGFVSGLFDVPSNERVVELQDQILSDYLVA